jgi:hypothetical protein
MERRCSVRALQVWEKRGPSAGARLAKSTGTMKLTSQPRDLQARTLGKPVEQNVVPHDPVKLRRGDELEIKLANTKPTGQWAKEYERYQSVFTEQPAVPGEHPAQYAPAPMGQDPVFEVVSSKADSLTVRVKPDAKAGAMGTIQVGVRPIDGGAAGSSAPDEIAFQVL